MASTAPARSSVPNVASGRAAAKVVLAISAAIVLGSAAGRFAVDAIAPQGPSLTAPLAFAWAQVERDPAAYGASEAVQGRNWAALAYPAGLRLCPDPTPAFLQACETGMKEEALAAAVAARRRAAELAAAPREVEVGLTEDDDIGAYAEATGWADARGALDDDPAIGISDPVDARLDDSTADAAPPPVVAWRALAEIAPPAPDQPPQAVLGERPADAAPALPDLTTASMPSRFFPTNW